MRRSPAERALDRGGRDVIIRNYEKTGEDDYGENYAETNLSPFTVKARVDHTAGSVERNAEGTDVRTNVDVYISATADPVSGLKGGGHDGSTVVEDNGKSYVVIDYYDEDNGLYVLKCVRQR